MRVDASKAVLKSVAVFEAAKGTLVLLAGFGVLSLVHHDVRAVAAALVGRFHLNPAHRFASIFLEAASHVTDTNLWLVALAGFLYAELRLVEAYGLWFGRTWAEWLAVVSGGLFLPWEVYELAVKFTWVRSCTLIVNLLVVAALASVLRKNWKRRHGAASEA